MTDIYHQILKMHRKAYIKSDGRIGHRLLFGNPTLLLRARGRRSGLERITALTYAYDGENVVIVASAGGADVAPAWLANIKANPNCVVQIGTKRWQAFARITFPDDPDYERRWTLMDSVNKGRYTEHQSKTGRTIPVVELAPAR
ncbi:nitroreductase/quinone reductase family protein [Gordonia sp. (in: high G+C Gram-positive bacteria)]|uniref:nitroreductase/quinone reductase family protein n=1 Tax=Gordonia sp. (in: high G+C Gram-positive bacteria) TaxID=84139 RepID=UPI003F9A679C